MSDLLKAKVAFLKDASSRGLDAGEATLASPLPAGEKAALSTLFAVDLKNLATIYEKMQTTAVGASEHFGNNGF